MSNIVQVDLSKIDREIAELQKELDFKIALREYAKHNSVNGHQKAIVHSNESDGAKGGITSFILNCLSDGKSKPGAEIAELYAKEIGKKPEDVRNGVYNALSRIKGKELIGNKDGEWFIKK